MRAKRRRQDREGEEEEGVPSVAGALGVVGKGDLDENTVRLILELTEEAKKLKEEAEKQKARAEKAEAKVRENNEWSRGAVSSGNELVVCTSTPSSVSKKENVCAKFIRPMQAVLTPLGMWAVSRYYKLRQTTNNDTIYTETAADIRNFIRGSTLETGFTSLIATALQILYSRLEKQFRVSSQYPLLVSNGNACRPGYYFYVKKPDGSLVPLGVGEAKNRDNIDEAARQGGLCVARCDRSGLMMGLYHDEDQMKLELHADLVVGNKRLIHSGEVARATIQEGCDDLVALLRVHVELLEQLAELVGRAGNQPQVGCPQRMAPAFLKFKCMNPFLQFFPQPRSLPVFYQHKGGPEIPMQKVYRVDNKVHKLFTIRGVSPEKQLPRPVCGTLEEDIKRVAGTVNKVHGADLGATFTMLDEETAVISLEYVVPVKQGTTLSTGHFYSVYETLEKLRGNKGDDGQPRPLVHGDVRKDNIVFHEGGKGYLIDFDMVGVAEETSYISNFNSMGMEHRKLAGELMHTKDDTTALAHLMRQFTPVGGFEGEKRQWSCICHELESTGRWPQNADVALSLQESDGNPSPGPS
eukprot:Rmarinus@m.18839